MWIESVSVDKATGLVKKEYDDALRRSGRVSEIVKSMSLNPSTLSASMRLYKTIMFGSSPLSRIQRELIATVVSAEMKCHY